LGAIVVVAAEYDADALSFGESANNTAQIGISIAAVSCLVGATVVPLDNRSWLSWRRYVPRRGGSNTGDGDGKNGDQAGELHVDWIWGEESLLK